MGVQLIFAVETNKNCNSDWIYIKDTIEHFYLYERTQVKLSVVYLDGKGNYNTKKKEIAAAFKEKKSIMKVDTNRLLADQYQIGASNIMKILDQYQELSRKN
ncbi:MAG: hypothetical protein ACOX8K_09490 [Lachnospiraceae bacterium]|jgi:hypothetical protein